MSSQRLKAALTNQGTGAHDGAGGVAGSSIPAVPQRQEQSQQPSQNSDAPSPVQPQVHSACRWFFYELILDDGSFISAL